MKKQISWQTKDFLYLFLLAIFLVLLTVFSEGYNLPGQNIIVPGLILAILSYQANIANMYYARNLLLGLLTMYILYAPPYAEPGSYDPRSFLSLVLNVCLGSIMIYLWANVFNWVL